MTAFEAALRRFLEMRSRGRTVIILTFVIGLLTVWPAADEYLAMRQSRALLLHYLDETRSQVERLDALRARADERARQLKALEAQTVSQEEIHKFRSQLADLTRRSGCRLRRIELGQTQTRPWRNSSPGDPRDAAKPENDEPSYRLRSQTVSLSVTGNLDGVKQLIKGLRDTNKLINTEGFRLRPAGTNRREIMLELEIILYDLEKNETALPT